MIIIFIVVGIPSWCAAQATEVSKEGQAPSSKSAPGSGDTYQLQLNSFKYQSNAKRFFDGLVKKGYKPFIVFIDEGVPWFKVRMGPYPSREKAKQVATELKQKHGLLSLILLADKRDPNSSTMSSSPLLKENSIIQTKSESSPPKSFPETVAPENTGSSIDVVLSQFLVWLKAWQSKQLDSYFSFYSQSFESDGKPFNDWQRIQRESLEQIDEIKIEVGDLEILEKGDTVEMSFLENFQSDSFSDIRRKSLVWKRETGRWRIIAETSEPA